MSITYQRSRNWRFVVGGLLVVAAAGAAYWWWGQDKAAPHEGVVLADMKPSHTGWLKPEVGADEPENLAPPVLSDGRPSDIEPEDWQVLKGVLEKMGIDKAEGPRIVSYLRYQHAFESWQVLDETKDARKRQQMARALLSDLPERLATGEFTPIEANLMGAVLLADLESDETKRAKMLEDMQGRLNAIAPMSADEQEMQAKNRQTELKRRQATAFAEWQAKTNPAERTPAKLEQAMEEVRRAYNSGEF